jgi:hypothetical protein
MARFFPGFLGVLALLLSAPYPVVMEHVLPMYAIDRSEALSQSSLLTVIAFAASLSLFVCFWSKHTLRVGSREWPTVKVLVCAGLTLLGCSGLTSFPHFVLIRVSARVANGIIAAEPRADIDRLARDTVLELRSPSASFVRTFRIATDFIDAESAEEVPTVDLLGDVDRPPFRNWLLATFSTVVTFKTGLLLLAFALYRYWGLIPARSLRRSVNG